MTLDFYIPVDCVWYCLIALYMVGYVLWARRIYGNFLMNPDDMADNILSGIIAIMSSVLWPAFFISSIMFYGIAERKKNENN